MTWIKIRTNLATDPRVLHLSQQMGQRPQTIMGMLVMLWSYADQHSTDGLLRLVDERAIDQLCGASGFAKELQAIGWLQVVEDGVTLPRYGEHNGQTAKQRAQNAARVARHRAGGNGAGVTGAQAHGVTRGEESRGEKKQRRARGGGAWI